MAARLKNPNLRQAGLVTACLAVVLSSLFCSDQRRPLVRPDTPAPKESTNNLATPDLSTYPWIYIRDENPPVAGDPGVEMIAVGDVMLGRGITQQGDDPFAAVNSWLAPADLVFGNLEAPIAGDGQESGPDEEFSLRAPPESVAWLSSAGFDFLSLANNHALDGGSMGIKETVIRLEAGGMKAFGLESGTDPDQDPLILQVKGLSLAFLAFTDVLNVVESNNTGPRPALWSQDKAVAAVRAVRNQVDIVVISLHWGYEYELWPDPYQREAAKALWAAGADLIIGHHPHVVQQVEVEDGRLAAYSLGNFVFDQGEQIEGETGQGLALRLFIDKKGLRAVQGLPVRSESQVRLLTPPERDALLSRIAPPPERLAFACEADGCRPAESEPVSGTGIFWAGEIDLTGDGSPEKVRRSGDQITVYKGGLEVWQSPPAWRVVDAALGDPNDDGRSELLLAIWQADPDGHERSQPYMIGYRGGEYKLLWGGRPVVDPILEVALGDVNGDGIEELVVIENGGPDRGQYVSVWRWTGWSFSLLWRSESGKFQDLVLAPGKPGESSIITLVEDP